MQWDAHSGEQSIRIFKDGQFEATTNKDPGRTGGFCFET